MTPLKLKSLFSEALAWLFFSLAAMVLALPLAMGQHQVGLGEVFSIASSPPRPLYTSLMLGAAGDYPAPAIVNLNFEPSLALARLSPNQELLDELNGAPRVRPAWNSAANYEEMIEQTARQYQVSPILVKAVIQAESSFNAQAVSQRGAVGLMQVMPATGRSVGIHNLRDPQSNITAGVKYLKKLLILFNDDERLAVAAYNCGPEAMRRWDNQPPYKETIDFVDRVMAYYNYHLDG